MSVDIVAVEENGDELEWHIQCKRCNRFSTTDADKSLNLLSENLSQKHIELVLDDISEIEITKTNNKLKT